MSEAGIACAILGILLLIGGFIAYSYEYTVWGVPIGIHPYGDLGITLMILGVVLIIAGAVISSITKPRQESSKTEILSLICPKCGRLYPESYVYCPHCKVQLRREHPQKRVVLLPFKRCPKCGKKYSGREYEYCPTCGAKLEPAAS